MYFTKMHALGNDFVVYGSPSSNEPPSKEIIKYLCDRKYGVGADSLIYISVSGIADFHMHIYNPDGFEAEICGNALKCSTRYIYEQSFLKKRYFSIETGAGIRTAEINDDLITVEIGKASIFRKSTLLINELSLPYTYLSLGNPHCVVEIASLCDEDFLVLGKTIENHELFPNGTNVEFASILDKNNIQMRVWERGIGETLSCSTGSCACAAALNMTAAESINVHQRGGIIKVERRECGNMFISGNCTTVFHGNINI